MNLTPPIRVGFTLIGGKNWTGGYNYLINLFSILATEMPKQLVPVLFAGQDISEIELQPFREISTCEVIQDSAFNRVARNKVLIRSLVFGSDPAVMHALRRANIDIVFEAAIYLGWNVRLPVISWIPDLQHRFFPKLFGRIAWIRRELGFRLQIWSGRSIMCSSYDVLREIESIYPSASQQVNVVRFAIKAPFSISDDYARTIADKYDLPPKYFFMPNQFWIHKNHRLVLEALKILAAKHQVCTIMASGQQLDPRDLEYVPQLLMDIQDAGLQKYFLTPGLLPYKDILPLMRASSALLNPSLFEGWSTAVEEARAVGVPMILSDIPVHREQAGESTIYFDPNSPEALADALVRFSSSDNDQQKKQREIAQESAASRTRRFSVDFLGTVQKSLEQYRSKRAHF